jgi:hypothetical protein
MVCVCSMQCLCYLIKYYYVYNLSVTLCLELYGLGTCMCMPEAIFVLLDQVLLCVQSLCYFVCSYGLRTSMYVPEAMFVLYFADVRWIRMTRFVTGPLSMSTC